MNKIQHIINDWPVKPVPPPKLSNKSWKISGLLGIVIMILAAGQIIKFPEYISSLLEYTSSSALHVGVILLFLELISLPALFRLRLSSGFRALSALSAPLVFSMWATVTVYGLALHVSGPIIKYYGIAYASRPNLYMAGIYILLLLWSLYTSLHVRVKAKR